MNATFMADANKVTVQAHETAVTRLLCAAAYLHHDVCSTAMKLFFRPDFKARPISYGMNTKAFALSCLDARRRRLIRDWLLVLSFIAASIALLLSPRFGLLLPVLKAYVAFAAAVVVGDALLTRRLIIDRFRPQTFDVNGLYKKASAKARRAVDDALGNQSGNVVVYSGFSPFLGSGVNVGGWSFAVNLLRGKTSLDTAKIAPSSFTVREAYDAIVADIAPFYETRIELSDVLCVSGSDLRSDGRLLHDPFSRPNISADSALVQTLMDDSSSVVRHYKCLRIMLWDGQVILSVYFRICKVGSTCFFEATYMLLPPLADKYRAIDGFSPSPSIRHILSLVARNLVETPFAAIGAWFSVTQAVMSPITDYFTRREARHAIRDDLAYDYGAGSSIRELTSTISKTGSISYPRYIQKLDREMYVKIIERRLLDRIVEFLDSHGIDTTDIVNRQNAIMNSGVMISGNAKVDTQALTVGQNSTSVIAGLK